MKDDTAPATKADIARLRTELKADMRNEMRDMAKGLHAAIDQVLTVLVNVDKRLTASVENHEKRITRLEVLAGVGA
jgi:hypothetical protein